MTEAEWLAATEPRGVLESWSQPTSERKIRLFCCACCRRIWPLITAPESRKAVEVSEALADGRAREGRRAAANLAATAVARRERSWPFAAAEEASKRLIRAYRKSPALATWAARTAYYAHEAAYLGTYYAVGTNDRAAFDSGNVARQAEQAAQIALLRDIFGNPFRPVPFSPSWRTDTVLALARRVYESRDFSAMPILADALQDAGCDSPDVLAHCRDPQGTHVRGCWVVDLVLEKE
ncbi:hypothetical protein R5W23_003689 [Gemmata sp. JC673]|uniref:SMI1/KNR4 family protein n=1 Tax=Gemmata algarum TaxID=2975278 RepID=A0ABU5F608_9BACT|nr:hypothetical protein [Gemmata algarum]MDY3562227.1 hypothetical protein [Gemmata algarum]